VARLLWKVESAYINSASPYLAGTWTYAVQAEKTGDKWQWAVELAGDKLTEAKRPIHWISIEPPETPFPGTRPGHQTPANRVGRVVRAPRRRSVCDPDSLFAKPL